MVILYSKMVALLTNLRSDDVDGCVQHLAVEDGDAIFVGQLPHCLVADGVGSRRILPSSGTYFIPKS